MNAEIPGANALPSAEMAKINENLGHEVAQDNPQIALGLLDQATELRIKANQEMLAEEKAMLDFAAETADKLKMDPERKAKFLAEVKSVLRNSRENV